MKSTNYHWVLYFIQFRYTLLTFLLLLLAGLFFPIYSFAASWYVDSDVVISGDGTSWAEAWNDFEDIAWGSINPGDTIYLSGGETSKIYTGSLVVGASGSLGNPITITRGVDEGHDGVPILDGENGPTNWYGVNIGWDGPSQDYVTVSHLRAQNYTAAGLQARWSDGGVIFEYNEVITGTSSDPASPRGIDVRWSDGPIVRNNIVTAPYDTTGQTDGIYIQGNSNFLVEGNTVTISNTFGDGHSDALQLFQNATGTIRNNILIGSEAGDDNHNAVIEAQAGGSTLDIYNNVSFMRGDLYNFMIFNNAATSSIRIFNNTFYDGSRALSIENQSDALIRNNIIYTTTPGGTDFFQSSGPPPENISDNLIGIDPHFVATSSNNFQLLVTSPAIDAGTTTSLVIDDILGVARPQGSAYDIGAYEFVPAPDTEDPTVPGNVAATPISDTQIDLSWDASTDNVGVEGYSVERCSGVDCSDFAEIATTSSVTYENTGLTAATLYRYRIIAFDAADNTSDPSAVVGTTTLAAPEEEVTPPPTTSTGGGSRRGGGSSRNDTLTTGATPTLSTTSLTTQLTQLRTLLRTLLEQYKAVTGRDFLPSTITTISLPVRDITIAARGEDVRQLQLFLIDRGHTIPAGATGYFGEQTRRALAEYQRTNGVFPAVGYYGPRTRAIMGARTN